MVCKCLCHRRVLVIIETCGYPTVDVGVRISNYLPDSDEESNYLSPGDDDECFDDKSFVTPLCCFSGENDEKLDGRKAKMTSVMSKEKIWIARKKIYHI